MSLNPQTPKLYSISSGTLTISVARSVSVLASGGNVSVTNVDSQSITLADGVSVDFQADSGNTLSTIVITPSGGTALVTMIGGNGVIV